MAKRSLSNTKNDVDRGSSFKANEKIKYIISTMTSDEVKLLSTIAKRLFHEDSLSFNKIKKEDYPNSKGNYTIPVQQLLNLNILPEIKLRRALLWLSNKDLIIIKNNFKNFIFLDENGLKYRKELLPEKRIIDYLKIVGSATVSDLIKNKALTKDEVKASIGILKKKNAIHLLHKDNELVFKLQDNAKNIEFEEQDFLNRDFPIEEKSLNEKDIELVNSLLKRKKIIYKNNINQQLIIITELGYDVIKYFQQNNIDLNNYCDQLTSDMLKNKTWKNVSFRTYDVSSKVPLIQGVGRRHPFNEIMNILRKIFLEMGFQEMKGPWVETQFWCMDSMWIPQNHPARFVQDTFFIPGKGKLPHKELVKKVKMVHENGAGIGSVGHRQPWSEDVARQLILRTHSTATTFRKLSEIDINKDCKYFYIANNFRNETLDATHLAEFVQAEGFIMADNLSLSDLMGFIKEFYSKLGITKIKFKPTYNPYTEPSMEAHYYDEKRKKWYALINSGIFRPEALYPFGIKKTVIAWGMGATRIASILLNKHNIREIVGPSCNFDWIRYHKQIIVYDKFS